MRPVGRLMLQDQGSAPAIIHGPSMSWPTTWRWWTPAAMTCKPWSCSPPASGAIDQNAFVTVRKTESSPRFLP